MFVVLMGALVATATPRVAPVSRPVVTRVILDSAQLEREREADAAAKPGNKVSPPDLATMFRMFDKFFPPQPEPEPARLALARTTVRGLLPPGSFGKAIGGVMGGMFDRVMNMSEADFAELETKKGAKGAKPKLPSKASLRQSLAAKDPHFDERMRLTRGAVERELIMVSGILEPKMREGLARAVARKLDQRQLADTNAFLATDSGRALGGELFAMWFDPDLMRSMISATPEMMGAMPGVVERVTAATAHLPKPPKPSKPPKPPKKEGKDAPEAKD